MHLTASPPYQLTTGPAHHAFTSCAFWHKRYYVAYRAAETHHPAPPGIIRIRSSSTYNDFHDPKGLPLFDSLLPPGSTIADLRDPRLIPTPECLYCICGGYVPRHPSQDISIRSSENLIQSFLTYTEDGREWAPLTPIYRPNYWIWSALPLDKFWAAAAYHTGMGGEPSSIVLLTGKSLLTLSPNTTIYDGANVSTELGPYIRMGTHARQHRSYCYSHATVSEPVLYQPAPDVLACCVRGEDRENKTMEIGVSRYPYQDWRWWNTKDMIHPSAILPTKHGLLLAGRELRLVGKEWRIGTSLYRLDAQTPRLLLRLPSANDTGYAGLAPTDDPDTVLCSYYSQHRTPAPYNDPLPGAHVFTVTLTMSP